MQETATNLQAPICPGCHFGCSLDAYRCGRGKGFSVKWRAGEPLPERRVPGVGGPGHPGKRPGGCGGQGGKVNGRPGKGGSSGSGEGGSGGVPLPGMRVMHALNIMSNVLQDRHAESAERKVLGAVERQGGFFALSLLGKRTLVGQPQLDEAVAALVTDGLAELVDEPTAGRSLAITELGRARQRKWSAEHEAATAEFLAPLSEDEQAQLADLLFRLIQPRDRKE